jgi:DNA-3-methyladenine glycosylase I
MNAKRCSWVGDDPAMIAYHDNEWGVPCRNDGKLFEYIVLDTFQAGLSWAIMIKKRDGFRQAFAQFDPVKVATYDDGDIASLVDDISIVRNRQKITATITNAQAFLEVQKEFGSFTQYIWSFVEGRPIQNNFKDPSQVPASTELSDRVSKDLKSRGFKFVGTTIVYAFMQAAGLINDHIASCFRHAEVQR